MELCLGSIRADPDCDARGGAIHPMDAAQRQGVVRTHFGVGADGRGIGEAGLGGIRPGIITQRRVRTAGHVGVKGTLPHGGVIVTLGVGVRRHPAAGRIATALVTVMRRAHPGGGVVRSLGVGVQRGLTQGGGGIGGKRPLAAGGIVKSPVVVELPAKPRNALRVVVEPKANAVPPMSKLVVALTTPPCTSPVA